MARRPKEAATNTVNGIDDSIMYLSSKSKNKGNYGVKWVFHLKEMNEIRSFCQS